MAKTFHHFSQLPGELRTQVWIDAIPAQDKPALFIYRAGCCSMTREIYWDDFPEHLLKFDYYYDLFSRVQWFDALLSASKESRAVTLDWLTRQDTMTRRSYPGGGRHVVRPFRPEIDILYLPLPCVIHFGTQLVDLLFQEENLDQRIGPQRTHLQRLAIPRAAIENKDYEILTEVAEYIEDLETLYVVVDHDDIDGADEGVGERFPRRRWELRTHAIPEEEASEILSTMVQEYLRAQRNAGGFSFARDHVQEHARLPFEIHLTDVAEVTDTRGLGRRT